MIGIRIGRKCGRAGIIDNFVKSIDPDIAHCFRKFKFGVAGLGDPVKSIGQNRDAVFAVFLYADVRNITGGSLMQDTRRDGFRL